MYLMIENKNEAPIESFTVFGASTSRGDDSSIGQFGSGAKFGSLVCMRNGINPTIYSGLDKIEFFTKPMEMKGKSFSRVCYRHKNKNYETSYTLEFGALDWDDPAMGLREFVSNAIDAADNIADVKVEVVDNPRASNGTTRVFVPLTPEVQKFYRELPDRFLQFNAGRGFGKNKGILSKVNKGNARIYVNGVFTREAEKESLFDYNFGNEVKMDESRNLSDFNVKYYAERSVGSLEDDSLIEQVIEAVTRDEKKWECSFGSYSLYLAESDRWAKAFYKMHGKGAVLCPAIYAPYAQKAKQKGFNPVVITSDGWVKALKTAGIKTVIDILDDVNDEGYETSEAGPIVMAVAKRVWGWLETLEMTKGKAMPPVKQFVNSMNGGSTTGGYYKDGVVYIEREYINSTKVMLEEMAHYVTGSTDNSRDFQDYAFKVASMLGEILA